MSDNKVNKSLRKRKPTRTSAFGSPGRIGHDSSVFYRGNLYQGLGEKPRAPYVETSIVPAHLDHIFCKSSESMEELPDHSVHLMVTSPPYNVGKEYDRDLSLDDYRGLLRRVFREVYRVLVPGGRACINIANLGRKPYIPIHSYIIEDALEMGFLMRGEVIWDKGASSAASTAWGSWRSASNPTLRDTHEYILIFCKDTFRRNPPETRESTISRDQFLEFTKSVWSFPAESARKVGHPAPFPVELPYRLIQLYTYRGEVVLDPFAGAGATCLAALKSGRRFLAYEVNQEYIDLAHQRISTFSTETRSPVPS